MSNVISIIRFTIAAVLAVIFAGIILPIIGIIFTAGIAIIICVTIVGIIIGTFIHVMNL